MRKAWKVTGRLSKGCGAEDVTARWQKKIFPLTKSQEEEGFDLTQSEDKLRHICARDGNHLLVPFQCDLCHFRNLTNRDHGQTVENVKKYCHDLSCEPGFFLSEGAADGGSNEKKRSEDWDVGMPGRLDQSVPCNGIVPLAGHDRNWHSSIHAAMFPRQREVLGESTV